MLFTISRWLLHQTYQKACKEDNQLQGILDLRTTASATKLQSHQLSQSTTAIRKEARRSHKREYLSLFQLEIWEAPLSTEALDA